MINHKRNILEESNNDGANQIDVDKVWGSICEELSDIVNGYEMPSEDVSPIDMRLQVDDCLYRLVFCSVLRILSLISFPFLLLMFANVDI